MQMLNIKQGDISPVRKNFIELDSIKDEALLQISAEHAVSIDNDVDVQNCDRAILKAGAIILHFPKFADGRAYSQARQLRERLDYRGRIIARGDVLADQVLFMRRCGIDIIEIPANNLDVINDALRAFSGVYQSSADEWQPIWMQRRRRDRVAA